VIAVFRTVLFVLDNWLKETRSHPQSSKLLLSHMGKKKQLEDVAHNLALYFRQNQSLINKL
jgi:hypothetical protein